MLLLVAATLLLLTSTQACPQYLDPLPLTVQDFSPILSQIDSYLSNIQKSNNLPGLITSIVYDQTLLLSKGYGSSNIYSNNAPPASGNNLVQIASLTKIFTDLLLYTLRENGDVSLDDNVSKYVQFFSFFPFL